MTCWCCKPPWSYLYTPAVAPNVWGGYGTNPKIRAWDPDGNVLASYLSSSSLAGTVKGMAWTPSGYLVYVVNNPSTTTGGGIGMIDPSDGTVEWETSTGGQCYDPGLIIVHGLVDVACDASYAYGVGDKVRKIDLSDGSEVTTGNWPVTIGSSEKVQAVAIDSNGDVWVSAHSFFRTAGESLWPSLIKLDPDGSVLNEYQPFDNPNSFFTKRGQVPFHMKFDESDNLYCAVSPNTAIAPDSLVKVNSSGTLVWGVNDGSSTYGVNALGLGLGGGRVSFSQRSSPGGVYTFDLDGNSVWDYTSIGQVWGLDADHLGNVYAGSITNADFYRLDSSGNVETGWPAGTRYPRAVLVDTR